MSILYAKLAKKSKRLFYFAGLFQNKFESIYIPPRQTDTRSAQAVFLPTPPFGSGMWPIFSVNFQLPQEMRKSVLVISIIYTFV